MPTTPAAEAKLQKKSAPASTGHFGALREYWHRSRTLSVSFLAITPLLVFYELGLWLSSSTQINGAEAILRRLFMAFGPEYGPMVWRAGIGCAFGIAVFVALRRKSPLHRDVPLVALEGLALGALLGPVAIAIHHRIDSFLIISQTGSEAREKILQLTLSVGAGVYEEILFRLILLSIVYYVASRGSAAAGAHRAGAAAAAVVISSLVFSLFHYWPEGEAFEWRSFLFRGIAGAVLGLIFILRGLGVAVYSHAAYDILVTIS